MSYPRHGHSLKTEHQRPHLDGLLEKAYLDSRQVVTENIDLAPLKTKQLSSCHSFIERPMPKSFYSDLKALQ